MIIEEKKQRPRTFEVKSEEHNVSMEGRKSLSVTGVENVEGFSDTVVTIDTSMGRMVIKGEKPPKRDAKILSVWNVGKRFSLTSRQADSIAVATAVFKMNIPPNFIKPKISTGRLSAKSTAPVGKSVIKFRSVAIPVKPPGEISLADMNAVTAKEYIRLPTI